MNLFGEKVLLRALEEYDNKYLKELVNDPDIEEVLGGGSFPVSDANQKKWFDQLDNTTLRCAICIKEDVNDFLGTVALSDMDHKNGVAQIHIKLLKDKGQGQGFGSDATKTLVKYAFEELRLNCIYAEVLSYNTNSQKMFEKNGFVKDGVLRSRVYKKGKYVDVVVYSIINSING